MNEPLIDAWQVNSRLNNCLLDAIPEDALGVKLEKGKTVLGNFSHMHNVRRMWVKAAAADYYESVEKLEDPTLDALRVQLGVSSDAISIILRRAETPNGKVKGFKPHAAAFLAYLVAHEAFHRAAVEFALRQAGQPLNDKVSYGLWEWGVR